MSLTKKLTVFITTLLATFCAVFSVASLQPATVFASSENSTARFDNVAYVKQGANGANILYKYQFDPNGYYVEDIHVKFNIGLYEKTEVTTGWGNIENATYSSVTNSSTKNYKVLETHEINVYYEYSPRSTVSRKNGVVHTYSYNTETLKPLIYVWGTDLTTGESSSITIAEWVSNNEKYVEESSLMVTSKDFRNYITEKSIIYFSAEVPSNYQNYVLAVSASINSYDRGTGTLFRDRDYKGTNTEIGDAPFTSVTPVASVATLVNNAHETGNYTVPLTKDANAERYYIQQLYSTLIEESLKREYTVYYLQPIAENVPFAKKVSKTIELYLEKDGIVNAVDVRNAVGVSNFEIFGTVYNGIEEDGAKLTVKYPCDLWLATKTVDGKTVNHFLNINESYEDYFGRFITNGVIEQGLYEYLFANAIANVYPEVSAQGLSYGDVYGYWDYVVLPETVGLNSLLADVLGTDATYKGFTKEFHFESSISKQQYQALLQNYNYNWLESGWNSIFGTGTTAETHNATHYILICDPYLKDGLVSDSGDDDKNTGGSVGEQVGDNIRDDVNGFIGWGKDFIGGLGDVLSGKASFGSYLSLILLAVAVVFVIWLFRGGSISGLLTARTRSSASKSKKRSKTYGKNKKKRS